MISDSSVMGPVAAQQEPTAPQVARKLLHTRTLTFEGYARDDGMFDIEGRLIDRKPYPFDAGHSRHVAANEPIHDMWVRLTIDRDFVVHEVEAIAFSHPYPACGAAPDGLVMIKGARIASGWTKEIQQRLGGTRNCTHFRELLRSLGSAAFQSLILKLRGEEAKAQEKMLERHIDTCVTFSRYGAVAKLRWPHLTGGQGET